MLKKIIGTILLFFVAAAALYAQTAIRTMQFNVGKSGLAIRGYDPVAYFVSSNAVEGRKDISTVYEGITYHFSSLKNRETFQADPAKYEPQYGGWCAYAMGSKGEKVEVDPETFKVTGGKLYLFYNKYFNNTLKRWNQDEGRLKASADKSWTKFIY